MTNISRLKELLAYFSSANYGEGYTEGGKFIYAHKDMPITDALLAGHLDRKPIGVNTSLDEWGHTKAVVFDIDSKQDDEAARRDDMRSCFPNPNRQARGTHDGRSEIFLADESYGWWPSRRIEPKARARVALAGVAAQI